MLSISPPKRAADCAAYFRDHLQTDFWTRSDDSSATWVAPGRWLGGGAAQLGLAGPVDLKILAPLLLGFTPDRRQAVQRAGDPHRRAAWDLTLSAPKAVSVLWALGESELGQVLLTQHQQATLETMQHLERITQLARRGKGGLQRESAALILAGFDHFASRALDPQIHSHHLLLNLALRADGQVCAIDSRPVFQAKMEVGAFYRQRLAEGLRENAVPVEYDGGVFRIPGVSPELERSFSKRRSQIESRLAERGLRPTPRAADIATLETRPAKVRAELPELRKRWRIEAALVAGSDLLSGKRHYRKPIWPATGATPGGDNRDGEDETTQPSEGMGLAPC